MLDPDKEMTLEYTVKFWMINLVSYNFTLVPPLSTALEISKNFNSVALARPVSLVIIPTCQPTNFLIKFDLVTYITRKGFYDFQRVYHLEDLLI